MRAPNLKNRRYSWGGARSRNDHRSPRTRQGSEGRQRVDHDPGRRAAVLAAGHRGRGQAQPHRLQGPRGDAGPRRSRDRGVPARRRLDAQARADHEQNCSARCARDADGKPDVHAAAVIAYYARRHPRCFAKDAGPLVTEYLKAVDKAEWARLVADLEQFIARLNEQRKEDERLAQVKKARDKDDLEHDDKKRALVKDNGTKADRQRELQKREQVKAQKKEHFRDLSEVDHEEELTSSGKVRLSEKELTTLKMTNKGFSRS